jgi:hypothetical protein
MNYYLSNEFRNPHKVWKPNSVILNGNHPSIDELNITEYPPEFAECDKLAHNRMIMGSFRYGLIGRQNLDCYDTANECIRRVQRYIDGGKVNLELIVDALNMCKIEFYKGRKEGKQVISIDDGVHATSINN